MRPSQAFHGRLSDKNNKETVIETIGIIPARYASTRLPGKPLIEINGKPLIQYVWEAAVSSKSLKKCFIATDDERIVAASRIFGADCLITPSVLPSGTDRIAFCLKTYNIHADIIVNIQGDEPLLKGKTIDLLLEKFIVSDADVGTLIKKIDNIDDLFNPAVVKVVLDKHSFGLYFSRLSLPFARDEKPVEWLNNHTYYKHIGIYAYRKESLERFAELPPSKLEIAEKLEQLRLLEDGKKFLCVETNEELIGVDTPEDIEKVTKLL